MQHNVEHNSGQRCCAGRDRQLYCVDFCAGTNSDFDAVANPRFGEGFCQDSNACVLASVDFENAVALVQAQFFPLRKNCLERCTARVGSVSLAGRRWLRSL